MRRDTELVEKGMSFFENEGEAGLYMLILDVEHPFTLNPLLLIAYDEIKWQSVLKSLDRYIKLYAI